MGKIRICGLRLEVYLGVREDEQEAPRTAVADIALDLDLSKAARTDDIADTVDYDALSRVLLDHCSPHTRGGAPRRYALVERLAADVAETCLAFDGRIEAVEVTVGKPGAIADARTVEASVQLRRD